MTESVISYTLQELRTIGKEASIPGYNRMTKERFHKELVKKGTIKTSTLAKRKTRVSTVFYDDYGNEISQQFRTAIKLIIVRKCKLKMSLFNEYYNTESSWKLIRRAFIHNSKGPHNLERLEWIGDRITNAVLADYLAKRFSHVTSVNWLSKMESNYKSRENYASLATALKFQDFAVFDDRWIKERLDQFRSLEGDDGPEGYLGMLEDIYEAFNAAIKIIADDIVEGLGYVMCYNLMKILMDEIDIPLSEDLFDSKTQLNEVLTSKKFAGTSCSLSKSIRIIDINTADRSLIEDLVTKYNIKLDEKDNFIVTGYLCDIQNKKIKRWPRFAISSRSKIKGEQQIARDLVNFYKNKGIATYSIPDIYDTNETWKKRVEKHAKKMEMYRRRSTIF